jgi:hypothetical protein
MDSLFTSLSHEQRTQFANAFFSSSSLDELIQYRDNTINAHIVLKGGHVKKEGGGPRFNAPRRKRKIKLYNLPVDMNDFNVTRSLIIDTMGDAISTKIFVNVERGEATITFDDFDAADVAYDRLEKIYKNIKIF